MATDIRTATRDFDADAARQVLPQSVVLPLESAPDPLKDWNLMSEVAKADERLKAMWRDI